MNAPISAMCIHRSERDDEVFVLAHSVAEWRVPPSMWSGGRAGWIALPDHLATAVSRGLKLKGLGSRPSVGGSPRPPAQLLYDRWPGQIPDPHFGIGPDLEFTLLDGDAAPVGGLSIESAIREQECASRLQAEGVPAVGPVAAFEYAGRTFEHGGAEHPIGVSVTSSPLVQDLRLSALFGLEDTDCGELDRVRAALGLGSGGDAPVGAVLETLREGYRSFGESLRGFSSAGWYRYSGHPGNIAIDERGRALLVDLDSCRPTVHVSPEVAALESVRDGMSALYNLACTFFHEPARSAFTDEDLDEFEPFSGFLQGWDPGGEVGHARSDGQRIASYVNASRQTLREFASVLGPGVALSDRLYRKVRHDRDLTFIWLFRMLYRRRLLRPDHLQMPMPLEDLDQRLLRFGGFARSKRLHELER